MKYSLLIAGFVLLPTALWSQPEKKEQEDLEPLRDAVKVLAQSKRPPELVKALEALRKGFPDSRRSAPRRSADWVGQGPALRVPAPGREGQRRG